MKSYSSGGFTELENDYKLFLLTKLTNAVHHLLADTENPVLQVDFCRRIEVLLFYGIKIRTFKWKTPSADVWDLLKEVSPKHIIEDILLLTSVKTDIGRIRAWIRVTFNECTLHSYLQLLSDQKLTKKYYEPVSVFSEPQAVAKLTNLLSLVTDKSIKVLFNCDSFDFEVAPSATYLSDISNHHTISPSSSKPKIAVVTERQSSTNTSNTNTSPSSDISDAVSETESVKSSHSGVHQGVTTKVSEPDNETALKVDTELPEISLANYTPPESPPPEIETPTIPCVSDSQTEEILQYQSLKQDKTPPAGIEKIKIPENEIFPPSMLASPEDCPILSEFNLSDQTKEPVPIVSSETKDLVLTETKEPVPLVSTETNKDCLDAPIHISPTRLEFPCDLIASSPLPERVMRGEGEVRIEGDKVMIDQKHTITDVLPGVPKDGLSATPKDEVYQIKQQMGNSIQIAQETAGDEYIGQMMEDNTSDPYADHSADSVSSVRNSCDNLLQLLETDPAPTKEETIPIPDAAKEAGSSLPNEPHSLSSSLYRLFSRNTPPKPCSSDERISNLSQIPNAVTDEIPISPDLVSTRSYILGAGRATASYTYESASQWLSLSKDMWWWLQKRVISEHDCQHPTPPQSEQLSGSPNSSSLLELCTENCTCCNAIVIDYCNKQEHSDEIPAVSRSCPPFSSIAQHLPYSPKTKRHTFNSDSLNTKDYFNIDILDNPAPTIIALNEAINIQKEKIKNISDETKKMKEVEILVNLRIKKQDMSELETNSDSDGSDQALNILGHSLVKSTKLSGYCSKCSKGIYPRVLTAYFCTACNILLHKSCINDISRHCSLVGKDTLKLETEISPAHGLHEQNYCCFDCGTEICYSETKVHQCDYNGRYYCTECHRKTLSSIPGRIIHNWDFRPKQISQQSQEVLNFLLDREYLNIEKLNPQLFNTVSVLSQIRTLREQIILFKAYFIQCSRATKEGQFLKLKTRQHFIDSSKMYTIQDLIDANNGTLLPELETIISDYQVHCQDCESCLNHKFMCMVCASPPLLNPFSDYEYSVAQCSQCHGVLHRPCFNKSDVCPYCSSPFVSFEYS